IRNGKAIHRPVDCEVRAVRRGVRACAGRHRPTLPLCTYICKVPTELHALLVCPSHPKGGWDALRYDADASPSLRERRMRRTVCTYQGPGPFLPLVLRVL